MQVSKPLVTFSLLNQNISPSTQFPNTLHLITPLQEETEGFLILICFPVGYKSTNQCVWNFPLPLGLEL
jgi:hypothetical protein